MDRFGASPARPFRIATVGGNSCRGLPPWYWRALSQRGAGRRPLESASSVPSPSPASLSGAMEVPLPSGRYVTDGAFEHHIIFTLPAGWSKNDYGPGRASLLKATGDGTNAAFLTIYAVRDVYADPCAGGSPVAPPAGHVEALVTVLRSQPGFEIGPLSEGTLDGRPTWTWEVTPTVDVSTCADDPWLYQWRYPGTGGSSLDSGTITGAVQRLTVVDFDGSPLIVEVGTFEWTTDADALEANGVVDTIAFD